MRNVLVTGATGFIGQHLVRALLQQGDKVRALGREPSACQSLAEWGCEVRQVDLRDRHAVVQACRDIDVVCHCGALSSPWGTRREFMSINVDGTAYVLSGCLKNQVRRCVYISSPSVISTSGHKLEVSEDVPYPHRPISVYSESKRIAEQLVNQAGQQGLETVTLRPKAVFGPGDSALVPRLLRAAKINRLRQIGNGENLVDLTYVDNVIDAILLAMNAPAARNRTYHITNDEHVCLWNVIRQLCREVGYNHSFGSVSVPVAWTAAAAMELRARVFGGEPTMTRYSVAILSTTQTYDISAAKRDLGYVPRVPISSALELTLEALRVKNATK